MPPQEFDQQIFLVIGSTSGIGLTTAKKLHSAGAVVVLHGPQPQVPTDIEQLISASDRYHYVGGDLSNLNQAHDIVSQVLKKVTSLDGLVFAAGIASHVEWEQLKVSEWEKVIAVNSGSFLFITQAAAPYLRTSKGAVVAVSSTNAERVNKKNLAYDVSKASLNHLIQALALELKNDGVRVNGVMPGGVDTPLLQSWLIDYAGSPEKAHEIFSESAAAGLVAQPEEIADVIIFLLSQQARWITGEIIKADFGASLSE